MTKGNPVPDVVIGLGNRFVHDDGVGLQVAAELRKRGLGEGVEIKDYEEMDLSLLQEFKGASRLIIVDSMKSGTEPGTVSLFTVAEGSGEGERFPSLHELELSGMIDLARKMGLISCPVVLVGVEPADLSVGEGLSKEVTAAVSAAVDAVARQLGVAEAPGDMASGPRMLVILVNQSSSMGEELADYGISMAEGVADVLNLWLQKITQKRDEDRRKGGSEFDSANFGILVIGYGGEGARVDRIFEMDQARAWANQAMTRSQSATTSSDEALSTFSVWINTLAGSDQAPLSEAVDAAASHLERWVASHRLSPPPYVISVTDGTVTGGDPEEAAARLKALSTLNGGTVLWTCQMAVNPGRKPILFPNDEALVGPGSSALFKATSGFPKADVSNLMMEFPEVSKLSGARAAVFDADLRTLVRFLAFVTRVPLP